MPAADIRTYRLSGGCSLLKTPQTEAGVVVGAHLTTFTVSLEGDAIVNGQSIALFKESKQRTVPTLGLYAAHHYAACWLLDGRLDVFKIDSRGYDGHLVNAEADVQYRLTRHVGLGLGRRYDDLRLQGSRQRFDGRIACRFNGPQLFASVGF